MKKLLITLGILCSLTAFSETEKIVKSRIKNVTVFLQGSQVTRKGHFSISKGTSNLIFEGVYSQYNPNSVQVKGKVKFVVLDVKSDVYYPQPEPVKEVKTSEKIQR